MGEPKHLASMAEPLLVAGRVCQLCGQAGDDYDVHIRPGAERLLWDIFTRPPTDDPDAATARGEEF